MKKSLFVLFVLSVICCLAGCTNADKARNALENAGMKDVVLTGYAPFACSDSDTFSDGFTATNPNGQRVSGVVCSGILKGATIRY